MPLLTGKVVVVPFDFSSLSEAAVRCALELVSDKSLIHVVYVGQLPSAAEPAAIYGAISEDAIRQHCQEAFAKMASEEPSLANLHFVTLIGDAGTAICDYAKEQDAELIVISSHGRTGVSRLLLGSVAERVVRHASCPVLVLRQ